MEGKLRYLLGGVIPLLAVASRVSFPLLTTLSRTDGDQTRLIKPSSITAEVSNRSGIAVAPSLISVNAAYAQRSAKLVRDIDVALGIERYTHRVNELGVVTASFGG